MTIIKEHSDAYYRRINTFSAILVPILILATVSYSVYIIIELLCIRILLREQQNPAAAITIIVFYFILFFLAWGHYLRLLFATYSNKDAIPQLTPHSEFAYDAFSVVTGTIPPPPGLPAFYTSHSYACDQYGLPMYCTKCHSWKPSRTHHNTDMGRCIRRMDHFCPWVGGMVGESNMKFFLQFSLYASLFCAFGVGVASWGLHLTLDTIFKEERDNFIAAIVVGSLFWIMAFTTFGNWMKLAVMNLTTVDDLQRKSPDRERFYAIRIPDVGQDKKRLALRFPTITYPLPVRYEAANTEMKPGLDNSEGPPHHDLEAQPHIPTPGPHSTHTFAIIRLEPGTNPWNLGTASKNLRSIFGNSLLTAISPFATRTYEGADYLIGPTVQGQLAEEPSKDVVVDQPITDVGKGSETSSTDTGVKAAEATTTTTT